MEPRNSTVASDGMRIRLARNIYTSQAHKQYHSPFAPDLPDSDTIRLKIVVVNVAPKRQQPVTRFLKPDFSRMVLRCCLEPDWTSGRLVFALFCRLYALMGAPVPSRLSRQEDIGQRQGGKCPRRVLLQPTVAHLAKAPQALDRPEGMFDAHGFRISCGSSLWPPRRSHHCFSFSAAVTLLT